MGSFAGVFIGHSAYEYFHYKKHPGLYEMQSAPWYASIQIYGLATGLVIFVAILLKLIIKNKVKN